MPMRIHENFSGTCQECGTPYLYVAIDIRFNVDNSDPEPFHIVFWFFHRMTACSARRLKLVVGDPGTD